MNSSGTCFAVVWPTVYYLELENADRHETRLNGCGCLCVHIAARPGFCRKRSTVTNLPYCL